MKTINFTWNNCGTRHKLDIDPKKGENTRSKKKCHGKCQTSYCPTNICILKSTETVIVMAKIPLPC